MYVYLKNRSEPSGSSAAFTVGFYDPNGKWQPESDHSTAQAAANRVAWLNGNGEPPEPSPLAHDYREDIGRHV
jgi:hypothetical protein